MNQDTKSALELNGSFPLRLTRFPWHKATRSIPTLSCIEYTSQSQAPPSIISSVFPHYQHFSTSVSFTAAKYRPWARWASERSASGLPLFTCAGTPANLFTTRLKCSRGRRNARPAHSFFSGNFVGTNFFIWVEGKQHNDSQPESRTLTVRPQRLPVWITRCLTI